MVFPKTSTHHGAVARSAQRWQRLEGEKVPTVKDDLLEFLQDGVVGLRLAPPHSQEFGFCW